jgi:hypothetical protein
VKVSAAGKGCNGSCSSAVCGSSSRVTTFSQTALAQSTVLLVKVSAAGKGGGSSSAGCVGSSSGTPFSQTA